MAKTTAILIFTSVEIRIFSLIFSNNQSSSQPIIKNGVGPKGTSPSYKNVGFTTILSDSPSQKIINLIIINKIDFGTGLA